MRPRARLWVWTVVLLAGATAGTVIGEALANVVPVLARGVTVGIIEPVAVDLRVISFTFGFTLHLNLAGAILILALILLLGR